MCLNEMTERLLHAPEGHEEEGSCMSYEEEDTCMCLHEMTERLLHAAEEECQSVVDP